MLKTSPTFGIVGCFQNGKSTLVNCLLDDKVAMTGDGRATTHLPTIFAWGEVQEAKSICADNKTINSVPFNDYVKAKKNPDIELSHYEVNLWKPLLQHVSVLDTPGFEDNENDNETAIKSLANMDFVIFVARNKALNQSEVNLLKNIAKLGLPFSVLMNCMDISRGLWEPLSKANEYIATAIENILKAAGHAPYPVRGRYVYPVNLAWFWYATQHMHQGSLNEYDQDLFDDIQRFIKKHLNFKNFDASTLAEMSHFIPFRRSIQGIAMHIAHKKSETGQLANELIESSRECLNKIKLDHAMILADKACFMAPGFIPAIQNRAEISYARKEYDDTILAAGRALNIDARDIEILFLRASAYFSKEDYQSSRQDLQQLAYLLESDWNIAWNEEDKSKQARKYIDTYLMKIECDLLEGEDDEAYKSLKHIIDCKQQPMNNIDELEIKLTVWSLFAGCEYRNENYKNAMLAAGHVTKFYAEAKNKDSNAIALSTLIILSSLFELTEMDSPVGNSKESLGQDIQRMLWKSSLNHFKGNIKKAVNNFVKLNKLPIIQKTWIDEPQFIPYYISNIGSQSGEVNDINLLVKQYFQVSGDIDLNGFCKVAAKGLRDEILKKFQEASKPLCNIKISTLFLGNSITVINVGYPLLSELVIKVSYSLNGLIKTKELRTERKLQFGQSYCWEEVFEGKSAFGVDWFGGKKLENVEIQSVNSRQGPIKFKLQD